MKKEFIILPQFTSIVIGLNYLKSTENKFCFVAKNKTYSIDGKKIDTPDNSEVINIDDIYIELYGDPLPGQLYIENDFLKYYKETYEI
jgi:hypothetical protein